VRRERRAEHDLAVLPLACGIIAFRHAPWFFESALGPEVVGGTTASSRVFVV
jgi:hypothetical protein